MEIHPAVRQRRKEIRDEAKRILLERVLYHPYFPHDIYINVSGIKEWLNQPHKHYAEKNEASAKELCYKCMGSFPFCHNHFLFHNLAKNCVTGQTSIPLSILGLSSIDNKISFASGCSSLNAFRPFVSLETT